MKKHFIAHTITGDVRFWNIEYFDSSNTTVVTFGNFSTGNPSVNTVKENKVAYQKRIKDKLKQGYVEVQFVPNSINTCHEILRDANVEIAFKPPMKCQKYDPVKFQYPCLGQPKLNGLRCYIVWGKWATKQGLFEEVYEGVIALSQEGCRYYVPNVTNSFDKKDFCAEGSDDPTLYFDGELYVYGEPLNIIKSRVPIEINGRISKPSLPSEPVNFYCFDIADEDVEYNVRQLTRVSKLRTLANDLYGYDDVNHVVHINKEFHKHVMFVGDSVIKNTEEAQLFTDACIAAGFEGAVFRTFDNIYEYGKRPKSIIKVKRFDDAEFTVVDIIARDKGRGCMFVCKNDINDAIFESTPMGSYEKQERELANKEKLIGKQVTIKFYERSGVKKCPFHSNVLDKRDYV